MIDSSQHMKKLILSPVQKRLWNEFIDNKDKYLSMVKNNKSDTERLTTIYKDFHTACSHYKDALTKQLTIGSYQKTVDPAIRGGLVAGVAGTGAGVYTALSAEQHNREVEEHNAKVTKNKIAANMSVDFAIPELLEVIEKLNKALNSIPKIFKYRENEKEKLYNNTVQELESRTKALTYIYNTLLSLDDYKDSKKYAEICEKLIKKENRKTKLIVCGLLTLGALVCSGIFSAFVFPTSTIGGVIVLLSTFILGTAIFNIQYLLRFNKNH